MDFKDMAYVIAVAKYRNITKAADSLYITQPTLSKFLQNLEAGLGQKLFKKLGNKFTLTYAGQRYVAKATDIINLKKELDQEMNDIIQSDYGALKVAFPVMRGTYMLPCTLPIFHSLYPNVHIDILEENSGILEAMLLNGETDLAFFNLPIKSPDIDCQIIGREEILLIMPEGHPLARLGQHREGLPYPWFDLTLAAKEPFILQLPGQRTRQTVNKIFKHFKIQPSIKLETRNISAGVELVSKNYGLAFVCETHLKHIQLKKPICRFCVGDPCTTVDFVAAYRRGSYLPYHAQEYIKIVKDFT